MKLCKNFFMKAFGANFNQTVKKCYALEIAMLLQVSWKSESLVEGMVLIAGSLALAWECKTPGYPSIAFFWVEHGGSWDDGGGKTQALLFMGLLLILMLLKTHSSGGYSYLFSNRRLLISWHLLVLCLQEGSQPWTMGELCFLQHWGSFCIHFSATHQLWSQQELPEISTSGEVWRVFKS